MKYAIIITLFNPKTKNINNLYNYIENFDMVIIYDNSQDNSEYSSLLPKSKKVIYHYNGVNDGLPVAFNSILDSELIENYDFLCTMDQDSNFQTYDIGIIKEYIEHNDLRDTAILAPEIQYEKKSNVCREGISYNEWVICSGSFLNLKIIKKHRLRYDEKYFLDRFDVEFCKQIRQLNYKIITINDAKNYHELGSTNINKRTEHVPIRHYYMSRNRLYFNKKYFFIGIRHVKNLLQILKHLVIVSLFEKQKILKIKMIILGIRDYQKGIIGEKSKI